MALRPSDKQCKRKSRYSPAHLSMHVGRQVGDARIFKPTNALFQKKKDQNKTAVKFCVKLSGPLACQSTGHRQPARRPSIPFTFKNAISIGPSENSPRSDRFAWSRRYPPGESIIFDLQNAGHSHRRVLQPHRSARLLISRRANPSIDRTTTAAPINSRQWSILPLGP